MGQVLRAKGIALNHVYEDHDLVIPIPFFFMPDTDSCFIPFRLPPKKGVRYGYLRV